MVSCRELKEKVPMCFEPIEVVKIGDVVLPNYAKAYACLWELATLYNMTWRDVWQDRTLTEKIIRCQRLLRENP